MGAKPESSAEARILLKVAFDINVAKEGVAEARAIESKTGLDSVAMEHIRVASRSLDSAINHLKILRQDFMSRWD